MNNKPLWKKIAAGIALVGGILFYPSCSLFGSFGPEEYSIQSIAFSKTGIIIREGEMEILSLSVEPASSQVSQEVSWSYDETIIRGEKDNYGVVITGLSTGETIVRATVGGKTASCVVTILPGTEEQTVPFPYIYSQTEFAEVSPGETVRVSASLYGGTASDSTGFSFSIDKPLVASLMAEGNYCWISGSQEGMARVTIRHPKSSYGYSFLVSCQANSHDVPYITTASNIVTLNKTLEEEELLLMELRNPPAIGNEGLFTYSIKDENGNDISDPPASVFANGKQCTVTPIKAGECYIQVTHPDAPYQLTVLVRVIEEVDTVYIEPSSQVIRLSGTLGEALSVSLKNLGEYIGTDNQAFTFSFPPGADEYLDWTIYEEDAIIQLSGKKPGTVLLSVGHPLAVHKKDILIIIRDIASSAAMAGTFISTSQNFIRTSVGEEDSVISVSLANAKSGEENRLSWHIEHEASDGSGDQVIAWVGGTGTSSHSSRSVASAALGNARIAPLEEGKAIITLSHPLSVYDTKILVSVLPKGEESIPSFSLSTETPYVVIKNGTMETVTVTLEGENKTIDDENEIRWDYEGTELDIQANGINASITSSGIGSSHETITISHPKVRYPLLLSVFRYDTEEDLETAKLIFTDTPYYSLITGESISLAVESFNLSPEDTLVWSIDEGASLVSLTQLDSSIMSLSALSPGKASVTAVLSGTNQKVTFTIHVRQDGIITEDAPSYLTTIENVILLEAGEDKEIKVTPINISENSYSELSWDVSDPSLIELIPLGSRATVRSLSGNGKVTVTVSHPLSANTLEINVHIGSPYEYKNPNVAYISTSSDTLLLRAGDEDSIFKAVLTYTEDDSLVTDGFSFSVEDPGIAAVSYSSHTNTCFITPLKEGQTLLTVSHDEAVSNKEILLIVEKKEGDSGDIPYITTSQNIITVISGEYTSISAALINGEDFDPSSWNWEVEDNRVAALVSDRGSVTMIYGDAPGTTFVTISHEACPYPLKLIVLCLDAVLAHTSPWIKASTNIATIPTDSSLTLSAEMVGGNETDLAFFSWDISDPAVALLSSAGGSASFRGLTPGMAYITVRNTRYPESYTKTILVVVEETKRESCYITVNQRVVKLKPDTNESFTLRATLVEGEVLDREDFIFWADDYNLVSLSALTDTATIMPVGPPGMTTVHVKHPKAPLVVDIVVIISTVETFSFGTVSKTIQEGTTAFIPMDVPPSSEKVRIEYSSADTSVCAITGSSAVAMIAGVGEGHTTLTATLTSDAGIIARSELAVIITEAIENPIRLTTKSTVLNVEIGKSLTLEAALSGAGVSITDEYDISWVSSDNRVVNLLATEQNTTKGPEAYITAKEAGEAVLTVSHPKAQNDLQIWVLVPPQNKVSITLDNTFLELFKDEGAVSVTAVLVNGTAADYNTITWTAPKVQGQVIISVSKATGKTCNIVPRNVGRTILRAQLPNGVYADCIVSVASQAEILLDTLAIHVNPGYTETVHYWTNPANAQVNWIAQSNNAQDASDYFSFTVNEAAKTITVTGIALGSGSLSGYFISTSGGSTVRLQITVEYVYEFELQTQGIITREPLPGTTIPIPFRVYPPDLTMSAEVSDSTKLEVKSISHDKVTGEGEVVVTPLGEQNGLTVTLKATNPKDTINTPILRNQYINLHYENLTITPAFDMNTGAFSYYDHESNTLYLGDGEEALFHLAIQEENSNFESLEAFWQSVNGTDVDNKETKDGGHIFFTKEEAATDSGEVLWRIGHDFDYVSENTYMLIPKEIRYKLWKETYSGDFYTVQIPHQVGDEITYTTEWRAHQYVTTSAYEERTADPVNTGISGWHVYTDDWWDFLNHKQRAYIGIKTHSSSLTGALGGGYTGIQKLSKGDQTSTERKYDTDGENTYIAASYLSGVIHFCDVSYVDITPYAITRSLFESNPNFYRPKMTGREYNWGEWWSSSNSWTKTFNALQIHQYATPTTSKNSGIQSVSYGQIKLTYRHFDGNPGEQVINVCIQKRECEAYNNGTWQEVSPGRWEQR